MKRAIVTLLCVLLIGNGIAAASDFRFSPRPNKAGLIQWRNWEQAALDAAKATKKPILLSLSAVWCHWCHVMDESTYSDDDVIAFINANFIPIRVDADRRPDIDVLYNQGGWPSTVIITDAGEIVRGGTYIPVEDMKDWLAKAIAMCKAEKGPLQTTEESPARDAGGQQAGSPSSTEGMAATVRYLESVYDRDYGGFGDSQKFPNPAAIDFLLAQAVRGGHGKAKEMVAHTLDRMAQGPIHDPIEGGFFRYATRRDWSEPHYEKMLDLNAEMMRNYAAAYKLLGTPLYKKILLETLAYCRRTLYDKKTGGFYGSQDADEGYYRAARRVSLKPPLVDKTFYAGSNALMISALAISSGVSGASDELLQEAVKTADFMMRNLYSDDAGIARSYHDGTGGLYGVLEDNVLFGNALIDLYNVSGDRKYMHTARRLGEYIIRTLFDDEKGSFRLAADTTIVRPSSPGLLLEFSTARANFEAAAFLLRLSHYSGDTAMKARAYTVIRTIGTDCSDFGPAAALCGAALRWAVFEPLELTVVASKTPALFLREANRVFIPDKVVKVLRLPDDAAEIARLRYPAEEALYLCAGKRCLLSVSRPSDVAVQAEKFLRSLVGKEGDPSSAGR